MHIFGTASSVSALLCLVGPSASQYLQELPASFQQSPSKWASVSYSSPSVAVIPGSFNRSVFVAPHLTQASDKNVSAAFAYINTTDFVAYDPRFFKIIGPRAKVRKIQQLAYQSHESPCYNPATGLLFFAEWGPPGGINGTHSWQYTIDTRNNNTLKNITTSPPTYNAHGCVVYKGEQYVVTDGHGDIETGQLVKIDPKTWNMTVLLNNYYGQPFLGFNDLDIDSDGNFWMTDSKSAFGRDLVDFYNPTQPTVYFVNRTTMTPKPVHITTGNANGICVARSRGRSSCGRASHTVYMPDTGVSKFKPVSLKDPMGDRSLWAYDTAKGANGMLTNGRFLNNPISYFYDGIRASKNGYLFAGAGDGVDVIDPDDGMTLGTIRVGGGENLAVSVAFGVHEMWIVGRGGVWHVSDVKEELMRDW